MTKYRSGKQTRALISCRVIRPDVEKRKLLRSSPIAANPVSLAGIKMEQKRIRRETRTAETRDLQ